MLAHGTGAAKDKKDSRKQSQQTGCSVEVGQDSSPHILVRPTALISHQPQVAGGTGDGAWSRENV